MKNELLLKMFSDVAKDGYEYLIRLKSGYCFPSWHIGADICIDFVETLGVLRVLKSKVVHNALKIKVQSDVFAYINIDEICVIEKREFIE